MDFSHRCGAYCAIAALFLTGVAGAEHPLRPLQTGDDFQMRRLMDPTAAELAAEEDGKIIIYDALDIGNVDAALDQNFDRIQNMMFTRIHHRPPTGSGAAEVEDDGCD